MLTAVRVPKLTGWGAHYEKFVRVAHQWPIVAVAAAVTVDGGTIAEARIGLTNMGSTPMRAAPSRRRSSVSPRPGGVACGGRARRRGTDPPPTSTAPPTTAPPGQVLTRRAVLAAAGA